MVELLIVMAIAGLMLGIGIPHAIWLLRRNRVLSTARQVQLMLNSVRLRSIKTGSAISLYVDVANSRVIPFVDGGMSGAGVRDDTYDPSTETYTKMQTYPIPTEVGTELPGATTRNDPTAVQLVPGKFVVGFNALGQAVDPATGNILDPNNCDATLKICAIYLGDNPTIGYVPSGKTNVFRVAIDNPKTGRTSLTKYDYAKTAYTENLSSWTY